MSDNVSGKHMPHILGHGGENVRLAFTPWLIARFRRMNTLGVYPLPFYEIASGCTATGLAYVPPEHSGPLPVNAGNNAKYQAALTAWKL